MAKLIKFPLEMANGTKVRTLEELQEHYDIASVIKYYKDGRLLRWLKANYQDEIAENLQESEKQSLRNIFSVLELPEPSDEDLKNVDLRNISDTENSTATENENLKAEIKKHLKDTSLLDDWKIFQNESDTKDKCVIEFENEKLQTFTGKTFEKRENFEKDVADFLTKLIDFHTKPTELKSNEEEKLKAKIKELENEVKKTTALKSNEEEKFKAEVKKLREEVLSLKSKKTAEIGDIAYSDSSVSTEYDNTKTPVGIVIEVTNGIATIVSLKETTAEWETAKDWCNNYTDASGSHDWHLPTKEELNQLYEAKDAVNAAINKIKAWNDKVAKSLDGIYYWSSSLYYSGIACYQRFSVGGQGYSNKNNSYSVRAVRAI